MAADDPIQTFSKAGSASESPGVLNITASTTAGNTIVLLVGLSGGRTVTSVTDSKGNTWTVSYTSGNSSFVGVSIATAKMVTPLVNGDTISITPSAACFIAALALEYFLDGTAPLRTDAPNGQGWTNATTNATGGTTSGNATAGDLVIGCFAANSASQIATPGAGYTDRAGVATSGTVITLDWESKVSSGGAPETATATWSALAQGAGGTSVFVPGTGGGGGGGARASAPLSLMI